MGLLGDVLWGMCAVESVRVLWRVSARVEEEGVLWGAGPRTWNPLLGDVL